MKRAWLLLVQRYIKVGLYFYYRRIRVEGREKLPKNKAVMLVANHQNALIDPLLIATTAAVIPHFLTRANVFNLKWVASILRSLQMLPIYRMRDGRHSLANNEAIFLECVALFGQEKAVLLFPEGNHQINHSVRPLSKGFTRIIFKFLETHKNKELYVLPVGLNYQNTAGFPDKASVLYGEPILMNELYDAENLTTSVNAIKKAVSRQLKQLTVHIPPEANYEEVTAKLAALHADYTRPQATNHLIKIIDKSTIRLPKKKSHLLWQLLFVLGVVGSLVPFLFWKWLKPRIKEAEFITTARFSITTGMLPIYYVLQFFVLAFLFDLQIAIAVTTFIVLVAILLVKAKRLHHI
jgi:1-acyl-sn-glycerol-3-phosphate acyltransferase